MCHCFLVSIGISMCYIFFVILYLSFETFVLWSNMMLMGNLCGWLIMFGVGFGWCGCCGARG